MGSEQEITDAADAARNAGCQSLLLFHCISSYPAPIEQAHLKKIINLRKKFGVEVGLSDHTLGTAAAIASIALGACAIEKHFTISRDEKGPDSEFSVEPSELKELVRDTRNAWKALGSMGFSRPQAELGSKVFRRSVYFVSDIKSGEKIKSTDIRRIRPGFGIPPKHFDEIIGKTVTKDVSRGEAVRWKLISND